MLMRDVFMIAAVAIDAVIIAAATLRYMMLPPCRYAAERFADAFTPR